MRLSLRTSLALAAVLVATSCGRPTHPIGASVADVADLHPSLDGYTETVLSLAHAERADTADTADTVAEVAVKVADDAQERQHGLMEITDLPVGTGMLFVFESDHTGGFWMFQTLIPLDIAYIDAAGTVVSVMTMTPCTTSADACEVYDPGVPYRYALEVPAGWFAEIGFTEGDVINGLPT